MILLLQDSDWQVRRAAAEALGRIGDSSAVEQLLNAATQLDPNIAQLPPSQRVLEHSIIFALIEIGARDATTARGLTNENPRVRRTALMALDQMPDGQLAASAVTPLLYSKNPVLKDTANWIVGRHPDWGGALAGFFEEQFQSPNLTEAEAMELQAQLLPFTRNAAIQELLARMLADGNLGRPARLAALRTIATSRHQGCPDSMAEERGGGASLQGCRVDAEAVSAARAFHISKATSPGLELGSRADRL